MSTVLTPAVCGRKCRNRPPKSGSDLCWCMPGSCRLLSSSSHPTRKRQVVLRTKWGALDTPVELINILSHQTFTCVLRRLCRAHPAPSHSWSLRDVWRSFGRHPESPVQPCSLQTSALCRLHSALRTNADHNGCSLECFLITSTSCCKVPRG